MSFLNEIFIKKIDKNKVSSILELGARDGKETLQVNEYFKPEIFFSFEANPRSFEETQKNVSNYKNIRVIPKAVGAQNQKIKFFPWTRSGPGSGPGPCSVFLNAPTCKTWSEARKHVIQEDKQDPDNPIEVECVRLEDFYNEQNIAKIDLICADIQGSELNAFIGLGKLLSSVKYIICEIPIGKSAYFGAPSRQELLNFLEQSNFRLFHSFPENYIEENALFINEII